MGLLGSERTNLVIELRHLLYTKSNVPVLFYIEIYYLDYPLVIIEKFNILWYYI